MINAPQNYSQHWTMAMSAIGRLVGYSNLCAPLTHSACQLNLRIMINILHIIEIIEHR